MIGRFALVLHSHLPWLRGHGTWPVGEEWLNQAIATSYVPVLEVLQRLAANGHRNLVTVGITPVLASQLDDRYCLEQAGAWANDWLWRTQELASCDPVAAGREARQATATLDALRTAYSAGFSPAFRQLADAGVIELLGGPATHPFQPLLEPRVASFGLRTGLDDHTLRFGSRPAGIWAPECGYRPGLESIYEQLGVTHFLLDGPTMLHVGAATHSAWTLGDTGVIAFGRDLEVTYRVWSPRRGYPGHSEYRDFHVVDEYGFRTRRVTSTTVHGQDKAPYDEAAAMAAVRRDAQDFVDVVRTRLLEQSKQCPDPLVVAAYDTELFGHWWHEGPAWLEEILTLLPQAGIEVTTLGAARDRVAGRIDPQSGSWGTGKDFRVWANDAVSDMVDDNEDLMRHWLKLADSRSRDPRQADLATQALLALSSDWAFMVSKDSAAGYARERHAGHHVRFQRIAAAIETGRPAPPVTDWPFPHIEPRLL
ncbi:MAG: 1,4-alpha-glucan branching protein domain-containing protein [Candidatus Nanopelagicales bacterium]